MTTTTTMGMVNMSVPNHSPCDPYREPAPEQPPERLRHERLGKILRRLGLWRLRWVRRVLGGRWERFVFLRWLSMTEDDYRWVREFWEHDKHGWGERPRSPPVEVGSWQRITRAWSVENPKLITATLRITENDGLCVHVGTMRFIEFLGSRLAMVAYYREDHP